jgi:hypothetical protein
MPLSPLAQAIYSVLHMLVPSPRAQITYGHLSTSLPPPFLGIDPHYGLAAPLGEIVVACRAHGLPPLSSIVVRADAGYPGDGYFQIAYPGMAVGAAMQQWAADFARAQATRYPPNL